MLKNRYMPDPATAISLSCTPAAIPTNAELEIMPVANPPGKMYKLSQTEVSPFQRRRHNSIHPTDKIGASTVGYLYRPVFLIQ